MLAKMEFQFSAPKAVVPVTIKEVTVHGLSQGNVPFMPNYDILGKSAPTILTGVAAEDFSFNNLSISPDLGQNNGISTGTKYLRESVASHPSGGYLISVIMDRGPVGTQVHQPQ